MEKERPPVFGMIERYSPVVINLMANVQHKTIEPFIKGIRLRRDSGVSVMYAEGLNSTKSSGSLQRTDRHGILGQKSSDFQLFL